MPALLLLGSCKNDQAASRQQTESEASQAGNRAVFGPPPEPATPENPSSRARHREPQPQAQTSRTATAEDQIRQRSRTEAAQIPPTASPAAGDQQTSSRHQPSPWTARDFGGGVKQSPGVQGQSPVRPQVPLRAGVGDPGELSKLAQEPPTEVRATVSVEPVRLLVRRWADTLLKGDLAQHMSLYAQTLDRFNGTANVSREAVRSQKQRLLTQLAGAGEFELTDIRLQPAGDGSVIVSFHVEASAPAPAVNGPYRLAWRNSGGAWKIISEERTQRQSISRTR